jgi:hypothetical protein
VTRLDPETKQLLWQLVEAARAVPRSQRGDFLVVSSLGGNALYHPGLPGGGIENFDEGDLRDLIESGIVRITRRSKHDQSFDLRPAAFDVYDREHQNADAPIAAQEHMVTEHVSSDAFAARYREAFTKWKNAEKLLWQEESIRHLTTIGHLCRECMQLFVTRLIELHGIRDADTDPAKTVNRLRSVIEARRPQIGNRRADLLDALVDYWRAVNGLVQRQEHGEQKEGGELSWGDGRRVLLHTAIVMSECDRVVS